MSSLFSCLHLLINSDFLFNRLTSLKCFERHNFSVKHNLQTPPLGQQLTTDGDYYLEYCGEIYALGLKRN